MTRLSRNEWSLTLVPGLLRSDDLLVSMHRQQEVAVTLSKDLPNLASRATEARPHPPRLNTSAISLSLSLDSLGDHFSL